MRPEAMHHAALRLLIYRLVSMAAFGISRHPVGGFNSDSVSRTDPVAKLDISARNPPDACMNANHPPPIPSRPAHSGLATASMICGLLAVPTCFATMLPAVIMGHMAMSRARNEGGNAGRAKLGLIFGYGSLALIPVIATLAGLAAPLVIRARHKAEQAECMSHVKQIGMALDIYQMDHGSFPPDLRLLESDGITTNIDELLRMNPRNSGDWLYFPKADANNPNSPLLISPPIRNTHVVLQVDRAARAVDKADLPTAAESGTDSPVRIPAPLRGAK
jgi:competence protein ComGC